MRIKISKSQWEEMGKKAGWYPDYEGSEIAEIRGEGETKKIKDTIYKEWCMDQAITEAKEEWKRKSVMGETKNINQRLWMDNKTKELFDYYFSSNEDFTEFLLNQRP